MSKVKIFLSICLLFFSFISCSIVLKTYIDPKTIRNNNDMYSQPNLHTWTFEGIPISTSLESQENQVMCSDGDGGVIIAWEDSRSVDCDIYAQRLNKYGKIEWLTNGMIVTNETDSQFSPAIVEDMNGGAIIAWIDKRHTNFDIYAQRINGSGDLEWDSKGICICNSTGDQRDLQICSDGEGGALIVWSDPRSGSLHDDIYAQRINSSGKIQWEKNGTIICSAPNRQINPQIINDGENGVLVVWEDSRNIDWNIFSQRINKSGVLLWNTDGVEVCGALNNQWSPKLSKDGTGGAIFTWRDLRSSDNDIFAQKINGSGFVQWLTDGIEICTAENDQYNPEIINDGQNGAYIAWNDKRSEQHIYIQKIDQFGNTEWDIDGKKLGLYESGIFSLCYDKNEGLIISWENYIDSKCYIYAQRINALGENLWSEMGVSIAHYDISYQKNPVISPSGNTGAFIIWNEYHLTNKNDLLGQYIDDEVVKDLLNSSSPNDEEEEREDENPNSISIGFFFFLSLLATITLLTNTKSKKYKIK